MAVFLLWCFICGLLSVCDHTLIEFTGYVLICGKMRVRIQVWERQVNEWGAVQLSASLLWSALIQRRLLFVCGTRQSMSSLAHFHSETLPAGQICQSKEQDHINIIGVQSGYNFSSRPPSWDSHLGYLPTHRHLLGIQLLWDHWTSSQPWFCPCAVMFRLHSLGMSLILEELI